MPPRYMTAGVGHSVRRGPPLSVPLNRGLVRVLDVSRAPRDLSSCTGVAIGWVVISRNTLLNSLSTRLASSAFSYGPGILNTRAPQLVVFSCKPGLDCLSPSSARTGCRKTPITRGTPRAASEASSKGKPWRIRSAFTCFSPGVGNFTMSVNAIPCRNAASSRNGASSGSNRPASAIRNN